MILLCGVCVVWCACGGCGVVWCMWCGVVWCVHCCGHWGMCGVCVLCGEHAGVLNKRFSGGDGQLRRVHQRYYNTAESGWAEPLNLFAPIWRRVTATNGRLPLIFILPIGPHVYGT